MSPIPDERPVCELCLRRADVIRSYHVKGEGAWTLCAGCVADFRAEGKAVSTGSPVSDSAVKRGQAQEHARRTANAQNGSWRNL